MGDISLALFTKPWPDLALAELAAHVRGLGFDAIELPVRPGFQVESQRAGRDLPRAARALAAEGVRIASVAALADEAMIAACAEAEVAILRVMEPVQTGEAYPQAERRIRATYDRLLPILERHGVCLGVQNHCGRYVPNALGLRAILQDYDPRYIAAVWDAAHEALVGMPSDMALDVIWPHLCMVNLKNGFWERTSGPEAPHAAWRHYWTSGRHGLADWRGVVAQLRQRRYRGVVCLTAEYSDPTAVDRLIAEDLALARALLEEHA
jgi:sugar phosphate isomerase/epimerase